jgi:SAM-dependent methyltransferase
MEIEGFPVAAQHIPSADELEADMGETLRLCQCRRCGLLQLDNAPVPYYKDVIRSGGFSKSMISSRNEQFKYFIDKCDLKGKKIVEVGCGAGEFIKVLNGFPVTAYGIEHDGDNVKMAREAGLDVKLGFAEDEKTMFPDAPYNAFISLNFIEHQPRPNDYLQAIYNNTQEGAYGYITVPDSTITINSSGYYDLVRDHIAYYTDETMRLLIGMNGFEIMEAGSLDVYTLFYIVRKKIRIDRNNFSHVHDGLSKVINATVNNIRQKGGHIAIWGASHQCFTLLGTSDLKNHVDYVIDSAPFKQGKYTPTAHIPIVPPDYFYGHRVDCIIIMAFFYEDEIAKIIRDKYGDDVKVLCLHESGGGTLVWKYLIILNIYGRKYNEYKNYCVVIAFKIYPRCGYNRRFAYAL